MGLSPPTRGSQSSFLSISLNQRSIPAHAGEPFRSHLRASSRGVYPRPRGGAPSTSYKSAFANGLSPPTRGSQLTGDAEILLLRSIPAHAGEPRAASTVLPPPQVYPRPRGGAEDTARHKPSTWGLSPPTRGSHAKYHSITTPYGSIPAHAGEPTLFGCVCSRATVYPRPRGGASDTNDYATGGTGLSPPTRGSQ